MTVLVDTTSLLFALLTPERLSPRARRVLEDRSSALVWRAASTWEVVVNARLGKLDLGGDVATVLGEQLLRMGMRILPVEQAHVLRVANLPDVESYQVLVMKPHAAENVIPEMLILEVGVNNAGHPAEGVPVVGGGAVHAAGQATRRFDEAVVVRPRPAQLERARAARLDAHARALLPPERVVRVGGLDAASEDAGRQAVVPVRLTPRGPSRTDCRCRPGGRPTSNGAA
jgi:PIN domain nuclease of toxin-antitoxin system